MIQLLRAPCGVGRHNSMRALTVYSSYSKVYRYTEIVSPSIPLSLRQRKAVGLTSDFSLFYERADTTSNCSIVPSIARLLHIVAPKRLGVVIRSHICTYSCDTESAQQYEYSSICSAMLRCNFPPPYDSSPPCDWRPVSTYDSSPPCDWRPVSMYPPARPWHHAERRAEMWFVVLPRRVWRAARRGLVRPSGPRPKRP